MSLGHFSRGESGRRAEMLSFNHLDGNANHFKLRNALTYSQTSVGAVWGNSPEQSEEKSFDPDVLPSPSEKCNNWLTGSQSSGGGSVWGHRFGVSLYIEAKCCHLSILECNCLQRLNHKHLCLNADYICPLHTLVPKSATQESKPAIGLFMYNDWLSSMFPTSFECSTPAAVLTEKTFLFYHDTLVI